MERDEKERMNNIPRHNEGTAEKYDQKANENPSLTFQIELMEMEEKIGSS